MCSVNTVHIQTRGRARKNVKSRFRMTFENGLCQKFNSKCQVSKIIVTRCQFLNVKIRLRDIIFDKLFDKFGNCQLLDRYLFSEQNRHYLKPEMTLIPQLKFPLRWFHFYKKIKMAENGRDGKSRRRKSKGGNRSKSRRRRTVAKDVDLVKKDVFDVSQAFQEKSALSEITSAQLKEAKNALYQVWTFDIF